MKKSNVFNDISPKNSSLEKSRNDFSVSQKNMAGNSVKIDDVYKVDNERVARKIKRAKKKAKGISTLVKTFALAVSATTLGVVGVEVVSPPSVHAEFVELEAVGDAVYYYVELDDFAEGVKVVLYNDFTNREQPIEEQVGGGAFEGLQKNMYYTIAVVQGSKTITKQRVYTKQPKLSDEPTNEPITEEPNTSDGP